MIFMCEKVEKENEKDRERKKDAGKADWCHWMERGYQWSHLQCSCHMLDVLKKCFLIY